MGVCNATPSLQHPSSSPLPVALVYISAADPPNARPNHCRAWKSAMPRVQPFYAVKCNPEPAIMKLLMAMGAGFDCASKAELQMALDLGKDVGKKE